MPDWARTPASASRDSLALSRGVVGEACGDNATCSGRDAVLPLTCLAGGLGGHRSEWSDPSRATMGSPSATATWREGGRFIRPGALDGARRLGVSIGGCFGGRSRLAPGMLGAPSRPVECDRASLMGWASHSESRERACARLVAPRLRLGRRHTRARRAVHPRSCRVRGRRVLVALAPRSADLEGPGRRSRRLEGAQFAEIALSGAGVTRRRRRWFRRRPCARQGRSRTPRRRRPADRDRMAASSQRRPCS
jgi:hypothetical protein